MATTIAMEPAADAVREAKGAGRRSVGTGRRRGVTRTESNGTVRFFLGKADGKTPLLEREIASENEALLESLKTGASYFAVSEWRAIADLSKEVPQIRKEGVKREERDHGLAPTAPPGTRSVAPAQAS
ncbi:MAG: hypothetical protein LC130_27370 [Bryobacterales bacterium]|nr:hypothetical protein [Bryobacterales bacterium]